MCCHTAQQIFRRFVVKDQQAQAACVSKRSNAQTAIVPLVLFHSFMFSERRESTKWGIHDGKGNIRVDTGTSRKSMEKSFIDVDGPQPS